MKAMTWFPPFLGTAAVFCLAFVNISNSNRVLAADSDSNPAINHPDKFAWTTFVQINKSGGNGTNDTVWETWALQDDVYKDPNQTPVFPSASHQPLRLHSSAQLEVFRARRQAMPSQEGIHIQFIPENPKEEEARMNRATFDFIVANQLWYQEGQIAAYNKGVPLVFNVDSKEVKAHWKEITEADKPRYHWQKGGDGKIYGLIALHLMTKDLPDWFWATWEHVDNPGRCKINGCKDGFGLTTTGNPSPELLAMMKDANLGSEWQNYRLTGSQTDFVDSTGRVIVLGNSEIEGELGIMTTSSCISCHSRATVDGKGGRLSVFSGPDQDQGNLGIPDPNWFYQTSAAGQNMKYLQLDFVWSMFNAKRRAPPRGN